MRLTRLALIGLLTTTGTQALAETVIIQREHSVTNRQNVTAPRDHRHDGHRGHLGAHHDHRARTPRPDIEANVLVAPELEHSRSNYVPDNYRLEDYDGTPDRATVCSGQSGRTLSTTARPCPDGQTPTPNGSRTYSTSP